MKTKKIYKTPDNYYFRLHHIRPRFKNDIERILLMVSSAVAEMPIQQKEQFDKSLNKIIKGFPGNVVRTDKTINNWRTEISALFSLILYNLDNETEGPSEIAKRMAKNQDLVEFFKLFCYSFQYPGGHLKSQETKKLIERGIKFKPAHYILKLLYQANKGVETPFGINKAEVTHCIFNDTRVTVENKDVKETIDLIKSNREQGFDYDWKGDVIRYAGDIMDYLYYANLLKKHGANYYLNPVEMGAIITFVEKDPWFNLYDKFYGKSVTNEELREAQNKWFYYVSNLSVKANFETDVLAFMGIDKNNYLEIEKKATAIAITEFKNKITDKILKTKEIGDAGENLAIGHECMRLKNGGREDLIGKVVYLPNYLKMGYDIRSFELDSDLRLIEVKTTISNTDIDFKSFHMTENEWNIASSMGEKNYVYRMVISRSSVKLFIIRNPVNKYKSGILDVTLSNGAQVNFDKRAGKYEKILIWQK